VIQRGERPRPEGQRAAQEVFVHLAERAVLRERVVEALCPALLGARERCLSDAEPRERGRDREIVHARCLDDEDRGERNARDRAVERLRKVREGLDEGEVTHRCRA